jgi:hypothetical protein
MVILCQVDFKEQIEKLTRFLPHTAQTGSTEDQAWAILCPVSKLRVNDCGKILPLRFEGQFTTLVTEGVGMM